MASQEERDRIMAEYLASVDNDDDDDDDDDDEAEFQPGMDDDDDDDEDDEEAAVTTDDDDDANAIQYKGKLSYKDGKLSYTGKTTDQKSFDFQSPPCYWSWEHPTLEKEGGSPPRMRTLVLMNNADASGDNTKKIDVTLTSTKKRKPLTSSGNGAAAALKSDDEEDDDDDDDGGGKKRAAPPNIPPPMKEVHVTTLYGQGKGFEIYGEFSGEGVLECRYRKVAESAGAAAAAAATAPDDDEHIDVDEGVDYNELIALHQDAGMSMTDLKKRYRSGDGDGGAAAAKKPKASDDDDDDDDDEIGF